MSMNVGTDYSGNKTGFRPGRDFKTLYGAQLHTVVFFIQTALFDQFPVCAAFPDPVVVKDYDLVGAEDGRQPVGYGDRCPANSKLLETVLDEAFTFIIKSACCFIKYQYGRIL